MIIGITGTRRGMTLAQLTTLAGLLAERAEDVTVEFHHGDCVGVDKQIAGVLATAGVPVVVHPPDRDDYRAFTNLLYNVVKVHDPAPYLDRNRAIVDASEVLWAFPAEMDEQLRSGTWATVRYADAIGKPVIVIYPDGSTGDST